MRRWWTFFFALLAASALAHVPKSKDFPIQQIIAPDGGNVWSYAGFDLVSTTNYLLAFQGSDTNRVIQTWRRTRPNFATNGVHEVTAFAYTTADKLTGVKTPAGLTITNFYNASGQLARTVDLEIGRTNSFSYFTNNLIAIL